MTLNQQHPPQREIKFRAWDKRRHKMVPVRAIYFKDERENNSGSVIVSLEAHEDLHSNMDVFVLMQSTGLRDKTDKEIYEGDIVTYHEHTFEIVFHELGYWEATNQDNRLVGPMGSHVNMFEIIGNRFEHPHLLPGGPPQ